MLFQNNCQKMCGCAGYCFIRLGQWAASEVRGRAHAASPAELLAALCAAANRVNVIRAAVPYMVTNNPASLSYYICAYLISGLSSYKRYVIPIVT
jgi:hypothetical protein